MVYSLAVQRCGWCILCDISMPVVDSGAVQVPQQVLAQAMATVMLNVPQIAGVLRQHNVPNPAMDINGALQAVMQQPALFNLLLNHPAAQPHLRPLLFPQATAPETPLIEAARQVLTLLSLTLLLLLLLLPLVLLSQLSHVPLPLMLLPQAVVS